MKRILCCCCIAVCVLARALLWPSRDGHMLSLLLAGLIALAFLLAWLLTSLEQSMRALMKSYEDGEL
jgi:hypothetical protein